MNRTSRIVIAGLLTGLLMLIGVGVWAAPGFQGTVPEPPAKGGTTCEEAKTVDMGTAIFTPLGVNCTLQVNIVSDPSGEYAPAGEGFVFLGDTFLVTVEPQDEVIRICYSYPPEFANKEAKIYKLNEEATPLVWVEIPGAVINDGVICVTSTTGVFSLIGKP